MSGHTMNKDELNNYKIWCKTNLSKDDAQVNDWCLKNNKSVLEYYKTVMMSTGIFMFM